MPNPLFGSDSDYIKCSKCGYRMGKPYPDFCPKCGKFTTNQFQYGKEESQKLTPKEFKTKNVKPSDRLTGVRVKKVERKISPDDEFIELGEKEYFKFCGITSKDRTPLFKSNYRFEYLLELTNNLDFIATSILRGKKEEGEEEKEEGEEQGGEEEKEEGGALDKMLLISKENSKEKCQFFEKNKIIYMIYGNFPDKKGDWFLRQMAKNFSELIFGKDVNNLNSNEKTIIEKEFQRRLISIFNEYLQLKEVFTDREIPYVENWLRIDYLGLSSMSIGVISLLLDNEGKLNVKVPGEYDDPAEELEMKESLLTAKIEAIAANTLGNTDAYPRWIAVKLGYQRYRFLTFRKFPNDYFLSFLSEGNLKLIDKVEREMEPILYHGIDKPFSGNLKPFNQLKTTIREKINSMPGRKFK